MPSFSIEWKGDKGMGDSLKSSTISPLETGGKVRRFSLQMLQMGVGFVLFPFDEVVRGVDFNKDRLRPENLGGSLQ